MKKKQEKEGKNRIRTLFEVEMKKAKDIPLLPTQPEASASKTSAVYRTYSTDFSISESEREGLKKIWESRFKKRRQSKSRKPKPNTLPISEVHSSQRVFS